MRVLLFTFVVIFAYAESQAPSDTELVRCTRDLVCPPQCLPLGCQTDKKGCGTTLCKEPPEIEANVPLGAAIVPLLPVVLKEPFDDDTKDKTDDALEQPLARMPCPIPMCARDGPLCEYGLKKNDKGCETCQCQESPCTTMTCAEGHRCVEKLMDERCTGGFMCRKVGKCQATTRCHAQLNYCLEMMSQLGTGRGMPMSADGQMPGPGMMAGGGFGPMMGGGGSGMSLTGRILERVARSARDTYKPECDKQGQFTPQQCDMGQMSCWCVDDRGMEIENTLRDIASHADIPNHSCLYNRTNAVHGFFELEHQMHDLHTDRQTMEEIAQLMHSRMQQWMQLDQSMMQDTDLLQLQLQPAASDMQMHVEFYLIPTQSPAIIDLADGMYAFSRTVQNHMAYLPYRGDQLNIKPETVTVEHEYERPGYTSSYVSRCWAYSRAHPASLITGLVGCLFLWILVAALIKTIITRRRYVMTMRNKDNNEDIYNENLAFDNQFYCKLTSDEKQPLPDAEFVPNGSSIA